MKQLLSLALLFALAACARTDRPVGPDKVPLIEIVSLTPSAVSQFQSVEMVIQYTDGDGDLGNDDPDEKFLSIKDSRLPEADMFHVQPLSPPDTKVAIKGTIKVKIPNVILLGNGNSEQFYYSVKWKDRAGNWSNEVQSAGVVVSK